MRDGVAITGSAVCSVANMLAAAVTVLSYLGIGPNALVNLAQGAPVPALLAIVAITSFSAGLMLGLGASRSAGTEKKPNPEVSELKEENESLRRQLAESERVKEMRKKDFEDLDRFARENGVYYGIMPRELRHLTRDVDLFKKEGNR